MVRTKEELISAVKDLIGDDNSDSAIALLEDITDTVSDYETKLSTPDDWKKKFEENDKMWRKKYTDRFSEPITPPVNDGGSAPAGEVDTDEPETEDKELTFEELFKTE